MSYESVKRAIKGIDTGLTLNQWSPDEAHAMLSEVGGFTMNDLTNLMTPLNVRNLAKAQKRAKKFYGDQSDGRLMHDNEETETV